MCSYKTKEYLNDLHEHGLLDVYIIEEKEKGLDILLGRANDKNFITHMEPNGSFLHYHTISEKACHKYFKRIVEKIEKEYFCNNK